MKVKQISNRCSSNNFKKQHQLIIFQTQIYRFSDLLAPLKQLSIQEPKYCKDKWHKVISGHG